jgi:hypothetical protein
MIDLIEIQARARSEPEVPLGDVYEMWGTDECIHQALSALAEEAWLLGLTIHSRDGRTIFARSKTILA